MNCYSIRLDTTADTLWIRLHRDGIWLTSKLAAVRTARPDALGVQVVLAEGILNTMLRTIRAIDPDAIVSYPTIDRLEDLIRLPVEEVAA